LRNLRQILAETNRIKQALTEATIGLKKKEVEIKIKEQEISNISDPLQKELKNLEIIEIKTQMEQTKDYMMGSIRKMNAYITQYNNILEKHGKTEFTEEDFEKDEERYHIMKSFEQGLCAARSHGGIIDEGNQIYFHQIGINGTLAQMEMTKYLMSESKMLEMGQEPTHEMQMEFLERMADKFAGCAIDFAKRKGMTLLDNNSLHKLEE